MDPLARHATALGALAGRCALAAALVIPLAFSAFTERVFEPEKAGLLRLLGLCALLAGALALRAPSTRRRAASLARQPLARAAFVWLAVLWAAGAVSVAPHTSLLGSLDRGQGSLTALALLGIGAGAAWVAAEGSPLRLAAFGGAAAIPAGLYGLVQRAGLDPLPWLGDVVARVSGPAGGSPMYAAHLAMALPLAWLCAAAALRRARRRGPGGRAALVALAGWMLALGLGLAGLVASGSRGPALGLLCGAALAGSAWALRTGRRRAALAGPASLAASAALVLALNLGPDALDPLRAPPLLDRVSVALDPERSTTRVRLRLWEGSVALLAMRPERAALGFGPETMDLVWAPAYPPVLAYDEPRGQLPDRAHNLWLDTLLGTGWFGLLATLGLVTAAMDRCLTRLGLVAAGRTRASWLGLWLGGGLTAAVLARAVDDGWRLAGPAFGLGLVAGLALWLTLRSLRSSPETETRRAGALRPDDSAAAGFAAAALAALLAWLVEGQVGFPVIATLTLGALLLGGLLGGRLDAQLDAQLDGRRDGPRYGPRDRPHDRPHEGPFEGPHGRERPTPRSDALPDAPGDEPGAANARDDGALRAGRGDGLFAALLVGLTLVYDLARPGLADGGATRAALLVAGAAALVGLAVGGVTGPRAPADPRRPVPGARALPGVAALVLYLLAQALLLRRAAASPNQAWAEAVLGLLLFALALLALAALWAASDAPQEPRARLLLPCAGAAALWLLVGLAPSAADAAAKEARLGWEAAVPALRARGQLGRAEAVLDQALTRHALAGRLAPLEPRYALRQAYALDVRADLRAERLARAGASTAPEARARALALAVGRDAAFGRALALMARAERLSGPAPGPVQARARALRAWALLRQGRARDDLLAAARAAYAEAIRLAPTWPELRAEAARAAREAGALREALAHAETALALDPYYSRAWLELARVDLAEDRPRAAARSLDRYFQDDRNGGDREALALHARALRATGRDEAALGPARDAVRLAPEDPRAHADLAALLEALGRRDEAREAVRAARWLAPADRGIAELARRLGASSPGTED